MDASSSDSFPTADIYPYEQSLLVEKTIAETNEG